MGCGTMVHALPNRSIRSCVGCTLSVYSAQGRFDATSVLLVPRTRRSVACRVTDCPRVAQRVP